MVLCHRPLPDLERAGVRTVLLHGRRDRVAPMEDVEALTEQAQARGAPIELRALDGDHHLAIRRTPEVGQAMRELLVGPGGAR